jgi:Protein of unknown function (DUF3040)
VLSRDEQDRWRHIEAELAREPQLARLSAKLTAISNGAGLPTRTYLFWLLGGLTGLVAVITGSVTHTDGLITAGVGVFIATVLVSGVLLIAIGLRTDRD